MGTTKGDLKGDTRGLDYGPCGRAELSTCRSACGWSLQEHMQHPQIMRLSRTAAEATNHSQTAPNHRSETSTEGGQGSESVVHID